ncbi:uncharacterized protein LOC142175141 [Nicotiana tabacum]|uniref:Uncharacterized protein LOC142175141 n=1 Tax=Nicotiana tabacum TaxID=4097 RepID=A0AC58TKR8_TOBAC
METYAKSYDMKVWHVIKKGELPLPQAKKDKTTESQVSSDPLDLDDYIDAQAVVVKVSAKAKNLLHNAISDEEYEKISSNKIANEVWDKLEVTCDGTNKVKETRINLLIHDYELFQMKDRELVEEMFSPFNKIVRDLKSFGRPVKMRNKLGNTQKLTYSLATQSHCTRVSRSC